MASHVNFEDIGIYGIESTQMRSVQAKVKRLTFGKLAYLTRKGSTFRLREYLFPRPKVIPGVLIN